MYGLSSFINGLLVGASLIIAIGAQNAFVLAQGLRREHHIAVALVCMICDALLIAAGVFGLARLLQSYPLALHIARWGGVAFLVSYALFALRRALGGESLRADDAPRRSLGSVLVATLAVTLLNPHVYIDTVVLVGSIGAQQATPGIFALGAVAASILWFSTLAVGAARLAPLLARPLTWRLIDLGVALMMLSVAWMLARPAITA
ncbi:L-lysine exporter family protein LysE/ArgO [Halopseudomonas xinjiangensis]|uniref:L-lysine exporter family protein LysE/ArgO n=1 Tax=Halopseudomonas xinjiangensis TaxID=487184 RepID=A0A1H1N1R6_9GAMM|nr:LysE/ArgO family amino acid transporter [Halopseudomonas xinjiangensis]SDR92645.1 L-lysine exporter family protein LysE/ArgO [Halopseudomonas xinjiangensis]